MRTAETVLADGGIGGGDRAPGVARHRLPAAGRLLGVVAALLSFGLLGLLAALWRRSRARTSVDVACRGCRRRRRLAFSGTLVLAGMVLVGSGLAVQQHVAGPGVPPCAAELPTAAPAGPGTVGKAVRAVRLRTRQVLTAPVSGLARQYASDRGGGLCEGRTMTLAFVPAAASESSLAVGSIALTGDQSPMREGSGMALASHESRHGYQWAALTLVGGPLAMPVLYGVDEVFFPNSRNHFERAAGLADGGYPRPDGYAPQPQWPKVGALGVLVLLLGRRRLRWASRRLTGGAAAAAAHQTGFCPLHSRGWLRVPPTTTRRLLGRRPGPTARSGTPPRPASGWCR